MIDSALVERLYRDAKADRWRLPQLAFTHTLETSCRKAFPDGTSDPRELTRYLRGLHLEDLALACACAEGHAAAWDHFVLTMRPALYRAADALDSSGGAREIADSLYADLYGIDQRGAARQSLLRSFHGRSSLTTWLRAVLSQRFVDRIRARRRTVPLAEPEDEIAQEPSKPDQDDPDCRRLVPLLEGALTRAVAALPARDRLRLRCYYSQQMTLAETGRLLHEHEATASRQLARTRRVLRETVERDLRGQGLDTAAVERCFECAVNTVGSFDLAAVCKEPAGDRSI